MRILFLLPSVPVPATSGARIRNESLLRLAGEDHAVDALSFGTPRDGERLGSLVRRAEVLPELPRGGCQRAGGLLRSPHPDIAQRLWSPAMLARVRQYLSSERYDVVQAEGIEMAHYLRAVPAPARTVYDAHNAELLLQRRAYETARADARRQPARAVAAAYSWTQWRKLETFERQVVRDASLTLAVSQHDANQLAALAGPHSRIAVVPNGIDLTRFPFRVPLPAAREPELLFVGKLDFRPNSEGVAWLVNHVMPLVFQRAPRARLVVVGAHPPAWLVNAMQSDNRIAVTGAVEDERHYLRRASLCLLPMQVGGGSRLKALVAMASGVPVLSTHLGMEGLDAVQGHHFIRAETAEEWSDAVAALLGDVDRRTRLAKAGRDLVEQRYDWRAVRPALDAAYAGLAGVLSR